MRGSCSLSDAERESIRCPVTPISGSNFVVHCACESKVQNPKSKIQMRFAWRQLLKNPGFTAVAVLTLAIGIGANTAMFSIIRGVLLKPLPYPETDRLVTLWERSPQRGIEQERVSGPNYLDWRAQNTVLADLSVSPGWEGSETFNLVLRDTTVKVRASYTYASLFTTLGIRP